MKYLTALGMLLLSYHVNAQYLDFLRADHHWPSDLRVPLTVDHQYQDEDAVILYENLRIRQNFKKSYFQDVTFEKRILIKYLSNQGVEKFGEVVLPMSEDLPTDQRYYPREKRTIHTSPELFDVKMYYYAARIHRKNGEVIAIQPGFQFEKKELKKGERVVRQFRYHFKHMELQPGDILEIHYKYEVPYLKNRYWFNSFRIMSHGVLPRQAYSVHFAHFHKVFHSIAGVEPDTTWKDDKFKMYYWKFQHCNGDILNEQTRPYQAGNYIAIGLNNYADWMYNRRAVANFRDKVPWYVMSLKSEYNEISWLYRIAKKRFAIDKESRWLKKFIDRTTSSIPDSMLVQKALAIHREIQENFEWRSDYSWYKGEENGLTKMGSQVKGEYLLDRSRRAVYSRLFFQVNAPVIYVKPMDKRIGRMSPTYYGNLRNTPTLFALPEKGSLHYVFPKNKYLNLFANELPFYWEGTNALIFNPFELYSRQIMPLRMVNLPSSDESDNRRKTDIEIVVDSESNSAHATVRVALSGQFSTLMRGAFLRQNQDSTIAKQYKSLPFQDNSSFKLKGIKLIRKEATFPFTHVFELEYNISRPLKRIDSSTFEMTINNWLSNIINIDGLDEVTKYYPDFKFTDITNMRIQMNGKCEIQTFSTPVSLDLSYGESGYTLQTELTDVTNIVARSVLCISDHYFSKNELSEFKRITEEYSMLNQFDITVKSSVHTESEVKKKP